LQQQRDAEVERKSSDREHFLLQRIAELERSLLVLSQDRHSGNSPNITLSTTTTEEQFNSNASGDQWSVAAGAAAGAAATSGSDSSNTRDDLSCEAYDEWKVFIRRLPLIYHKQPTLSSAPASSDTADDNGSTAATADGGGDGGVGTTTNAGGTNTSMNVISDEPEEVERPVIQIHRYFSDEFDHHYPVAETITIFRGRKTPQSLR
jgi:hypothetical protein